MGTRRQIARTIWLG